MRTRPTVLAPALPGSARASNGIAPLSPASGATVPAGTRPTFRMRVHGEGAVRLRVCRWLDCTTSLQDCRQEGAVPRFRIG